MNCQNCAHYDRHPCSPTSGEDGWCNHLERKVWDETARNCDGFGFRPKGLPDSMKHYRKATPEDIAKLGADKEYMSRVRASFSTDELTESDVADKGRVTYG